MVSMDFDSLKQQIKKAAKNAFLENVTKHGEEICAFALVSDDGAMTVVPYTNTKTHLLKMQKEDPVYKEVYEFEPSEWYTSDGANDEINNNLQKDILVLFGISDTLEPEEHLIKWAKRINIDMYGDSYEAYHNKVWE